MISRCVDWRRAPRAPQNHTPQSNMLTFNNFSLFIAAPAVVVFASIEAIVLTRRGTYDWRAFGLSVFDLALRIAVGLLLPLSIATPLIRWAFQHRVAEIGLHGAGAIALLFIGQEFCYYWYHRAAHRVRWFWANHAVHHSPNTLNLSAAFRIGAFGKLAGLSIFFVPLIWLGFDPKVVFSVLTLNLLYQFWIHATWIPKLGWLEGILNTPSAHRVHHAANVEYLDANFGGVLVVFDRLFGTYVVERADLPCRFGLVTPLVTNNPLKVEFFEWGNLLRDLSQARTARAFIGHLLMPPGWSPDGAGHTTAELRRLSLAEQRPADQPLRAPAQA
jgi:sterol desaturase/sphingolipid hydroxylase (fatty acid hydroxylase superfamily)